MPQPIRLCWPFQWSLAAILLTAASTSYAASPCQSQAKAFLAKSGWLNSESAPVIAPGSEGVVLAAPVAVGKWLEQHAFKDGRIEIRQITQKITTIHGFDPASRCVETSRTETNRSLPFMLSISVDPKMEVFEDADLKRLLTHVPKGLIYVWSPKMPISVSGMEEISKTAKNLALPVTFLMDPAVATADFTGGKKPYPVSKNSMRLARSFELARRGAFLHFPSLFYFSNRKLNSTPPVLGYRGEDGWAAIVSAEMKMDDSLASARKLASTETPELADPGAPGVAGSIQAKIVRKVKLPKEFGYFDKPVWGTSWIGVHEDWKASSFFNLSTGDLVDLGITNDTYATPTLKHLYTTFWAEKRVDSPGPLGIAESEEFLQRTKDANHVIEPLLKDTSMRADYQSVGILSATHGSATYRVITGGYKNKLTYRDYKITQRSGSTAPKIEPVAPTGILCEKTLGDAQWGTPMLSKDGQVVAVGEGRPINDPQGAQYQPDLEMKINESTAFYQINPSDPQSCTRLDYSLSMPTSKVAFSFDRKWAAFHYQDQLYIYHLAADKKLYRIDGLEEQMGAGVGWFPEFLPESGNLIIPYTLKGEPGAKSHEMYFVEIDPGLSQLDRSAGFPTPSEP